MLNKFEETAAFIKKKTGTTAKIGIILGTGLGGLVKEIEIEHTLDYSEIPHFPVSTVESHSGKLIFGKLGGKEVLAMQGRFHYYEGYSLQECTFPVRVMKLLGVETLLVSNASGATNPKMKTGDLMILKDHINLLGDNPLRGQNIHELGPRFPEMSEPYNKELIRKAVEISQNLPIKVHTGVYVAVQGPNLETAAEYKFLHRIGADVVGMSTVPEVLVARHMNMRVFAVSVITDEGWHEELEVVTLEDVLRAANKAEPQMTELLKQLVKQL